MHKIAVDQTTVDLLIDYLGRYGEQLVGKIKPRSKKKAQAETEFESASLSITDANIDNDDAGDLA